MGGNGPDEDEGEEEKGLVYRLTRSPLYALGGLIVAILSQTAVNVLTPITLYWVRVRTPLLPALASTPTPTPTPVTPNGTAYPLVSDIIVPGGGLVIEIVLAFVFVLAIVFVFLVLLYRRYFRRSVPLRGLLVGAVVGALLGLLVGVFLLPDIGSVAVLLLGIAGAVVGDVVLEER